MGDIITGSDIADALMPQHYVALFDRDGDGAVAGDADLAAVAKAVAVGESTFKMRTAAAYPGGFSAAPGTVDEAIKAHVVAFAVHHAIRFSPLATGTAGAPYRQAYLDAVEFTRALATNSGETPVTASVAEPLPHAAAVGLVTVDGRPADPFARAARGGDASDY